MSDVFVASVAATTDTRAYLRRSIQSKIADYADHWFPSARQAPVRGLGITVSAETWPSLSTGQRQRGLEMAPECYGCGHSNANEEAACCGCCTSKNGVGDLFEACAHSLMHVHCERRFEEHQA